MVFTIERRVPGGPWQRAETLIPNPYCKGYWGDDDEGVAKSFPTLEGETIHHDWSFAPRDKWLREMHWPEQQPVPQDATQETREFLEAWTELDGRQMLTLRHLEEMDWVHVYRPTFPSILEKDRREILEIREAVLTRLRPPSAPDDVRLIYGWNV